jgi:calcineurin-like phosphoesterase family protein
MNEEFIDNINDLVKEDDVLWHLGDFVLAVQEKIKTQAFSFRKRIRCKTVI